MAANKWGNWIVEGPLGSTSGQGDTFLVYKEGDSERTLFVLKTIKSKGPFGNRVERFRNEIEAGMRLVHANVTRVIDPELDLPKPFIVTEYCAGGALTPAALRGRTLLERLALFRDICSGVAYAHGQGVVHRDLKPDNIFLRADGTPVVGDFGLCYFLDREQDRVTNLEEAVGARGYMAPECEGGRQETVSPSADVYSLGKILYWILAGRGFARERHRSTENDLSRDPSDLGMRLVYELLDKTVVEDVAQRLPDASAIVSELDAIVPRIVARRRAVELARRPLSLSGPHEVKIASFRLGGLPDWQSFDPGPARVVGFAGRGQMFAAWGIEERGEGESTLRVWTGGPYGGWEARPVRLDNPCVPQSAGQQTLCVDERSGAILVVAAAPDKAATAHLVRLRPQGAATVEVFAEKVAAPRNCALATGPGGRAAGYIGAWEEIVPDAMGVTILRDPGREDRHHFAPHTNFPGPLAIGGDGTLHQAVVLSFPAGKHEARELRYLCKPPGQEWAEVVIDSTSIRGAFGDFTPEGSMSAHIHLNLTPLGRPVILASPKASQAVALVLYAKDGTDFEQHEIDMQEVAESLGLTAIDTSNAKQILFDEDGLGHIALASVAGGSAEVICVTIDDQWRVVDRRAFPASVFLGMGLDSAGNVHVAMR